VSAGIPWHTDWNKMVNAAIAPGAGLRNEGSAWRLAVNGQEVRFHLPAGMVTEIFDRLASGPCPLTVIATAMQSAEEGAFLQRQIERLWAAGLLSQVLVDGDRPTARFTNSGSTAFLASSIDPSQCYAWSSSAYVRAVTSWLRLESADTGASIEVDPRCTDLVNAVMRFATEGSIMDLCSPFDSRLQALISWLVTANFLKPADQVEVNGNLSFSDQLMHARSRRGRHLGGYGATGRAGAGSPPEPAIATPRGGRQLGLEVPDMRSLCENDQPFTAVLEGRQSERRHGNSPLDQRTLGHFLYRAARVRCTDGAGNYDIATRPYPSGGALYSIEFYIVVNRSADVPQGLYWYDALHHGLNHVAGLDQDVKQLVGDAVTSCGAAPDPHALVILAARFGRVTWKYESIAYALILKEVGVIYQTMYLVATAMGLASCAIGGGNSPLFCKASGKQYWEESSVGEFLLGTRP
jgi:SagB-type dehydrogenase family enzyme